MKLPRLLQIGITFIVAVVVAFALNDFVRKNIGLPSPETGWHRELWDAGYGSWAFGGFGVFYAIDIPNNYGLVSKLGRGWISDGETEDVISLSFYPPNKPDIEFKVFQEYHDRCFPKAPIVVSPARTVLINGVPFKRIDFVAAEAEHENGEEKPENEGEHKGFWIYDSKVALVAELRTEEKIRISEKIAATLRRR